MATKAWTEKLAGFYEDNDELRKWFLYEAGSGLFKFTGETSSGKPYTADKSPVANQIVVFTKEGGIKPTYPMTMLKWAADHTSALDAQNIDISYKTTGISGYIATRLASEAYDSELPMLQEEISRLHEQYMLNEGVFSRGFSWVKDKVSLLFDKIKNAVKIFVEKVIKKIIDGLKLLAEKSHTLFMEAVGIKGSVKIPVPSW